MERKAEPEQRKEEGKSAGKGAGGEPRYHLGHGEHLGLPGHLQIAQTQNAHAFQWL